MEKNEDEIIKIINNFIKGEIEEEEWNNYSVYKSIKNKHDIKKRYVYNEFSLQHELGNYFRHLGYIVKFEYNVLNFNQYIQTCKKEMDILLIDEKKKAKYAIELKYLTKDAAVPKRMFCCVEDMRFMQDVVNGIDEITKTYCVVVTENHRFYKGNCGEGNTELIIGKNGYEDYMSSLKEKIGTNNNKKNDNKKKISKHKKEYIKKQIEMAKSLIENPKEFPNIYEYFRKPKETWKKKAKYIYNNSRDSLSIIDVSDFSKYVANQFEWEYVNNEKYEEKYYVLKFTEKNRKKYEK